MTPSKAEKQQKKCPKCEAHCDYGTEFCEKCNHAFKPRVVQNHEIKRLLIDRYGSPRLNVRSNDVVLNDRSLNADEIGWLYLDLSSVEEKWTQQATIDAIYAMAYENRFDPVRLYLEEIKATVKPLQNEVWQNLDKYLLGTENKYVASFMMQYLVGAVARIMNPGLEARCSPVLIGTQHRGKSSLGKILFGEDHWVEGIQDFGRDSIMRCQMGWGVELSELDGVTRRSDIESLKTFLTTTRDHYRKPYGKGTIAFDRNFVFWGTSNRPPLRDLSGNSRFLCIATPDQLLPLEWATRNRDALWAKALEEYETGFDWRAVTEDERNARNVINEDYQQHDPWLDNIEALLKRHPDGYIKFEAIYEELEVPKERRNNANAARIKDIIEIGLGWKYGVRRYSGISIRAFWRPEPKPMSKEELEDIF